MPFGCRVPLFHHAYCCALHPTSQLNRNGRPSDNNVATERWVWVPLSSVYIRLQLTESHKWIEMGEKIAARHWSVVRWHRSSVEGHSREADVNKICIWTLDRTLHIRIGRCWTMMIALPFRVSYDLRIYYVSGRILFGQRTSLSIWSNLWKLYGVRVPRTHSSVFVRIQHPYQLSRQRKPYSYERVCDWRSTTKQPHIRTSSVGVRFHCILNFSCKWEINF